MSDRAGREVNDCTVQEHATRCTCPVDASNKTHTRTLKGFKSRDLSVKRAAGSTSEDRPSLSDAPTKSPPSPSNHHVDSSSCARTAASASTLKTSSITTTGGVELVVELAFEL